MNFPKGLFLLATLYINCLKLNLTYSRTPFFTDLFFQMFRLVFYHGCNMYSVMYILFLLFDLLIWYFWYNVCDCHAIIKGNLLTYLLKWLHNKLKILRNGEKQL